MIHSDSFVCGLGLDSIQTHLLTESNLTCVKAVEIALSMEIANRDTINLQSSRGHGTERAPLLHEWILGSSATVWLKRTIAAIEKGTELMTAGLERRCATNVSTRAILEQHRNLKGQQTKGSTHKVMQGRNSDSGDKFLETWS